MATIDQGKSGTVTVRIPAAYIKLLEARALITDSNINQIINQILKRELELREDITR